MIRRHSQFNLRQFTFHIVIVLTFCFAACKQKSQNSALEVNKRPKADSSSDSKVSLELSIPSNEVGRTLFLDCANNYVSVILRNNSDSVVRFYETANSWGYGNYTFIIRTNDTTYYLTKAGSNFFKNIPAYHTLFPKETLILNFNIKDAKCDFRCTETGQLKRTILRGSGDGWQGLPSRPVTDATIQAMYKLSNGDIDFEPFGVTIYSDVLLSNTLKIHVAK